MSGTVYPWLAMSGSIASTLFLILSLNFNRWQQNRVPYLFIIIFLLLIFTITSPFTYVAWGGAPAYLLLSILFLTDFRELKNLRLLKFDCFLLLTIFVINCAILVVGFGIVMNKSFAIQLIGVYYQAINNELYEQMIIWYAKPVTIFGSHSTAALAYFSLFILNFKISSSTHLSFFWRLTYLMFSLLFATLNFYLLSNTALVMSIFMLVIIVARCIAYFSIRLNIVFFILFFVVAFGIFSELDFLGVILVENSGNGFLSRYTSGGRLQSTYNYLIDNYFLPIGLTYSNGLALGDNFIAEYVLKISIFGYLLLLYYMWGWLRRHLDFSVSMGFLSFFMLADLAYPLLVYYRIAAALPFYVLVWSRLESNYFLDRKKMAENNFIVGRSVLILP
jgi:hypothetical protein